MFLTTLQDAEAFAADVTIVGAGPAGLALALELDRLGLRVLVLESGLHKASKLHQDLALADRIDLARHDDMAIATQRSLGGTSNLWGARCLPYDPVDFLAGRRFCAATWPITRADIEPHFARAAELLSIGSPDFDEPIVGLAPGSGDFELAHKERYSTRPAFQKAHEEALKTSVGVAILLDAAMVSAVFSGMRVEAVEVAGLHRSRGILSVRRLVIAAGGVETTRLLLALQRAKPELAGGPEGALGRYYMGHLFGEIADITIASPELDAALVFRIDRSGSYARQRFVPSVPLQLSEGLPNVAFWPVVPTISDPRHRDAFLSLLFLIFAFRPLGRLLVAEAIRKRHVPPGTPIVPHLRNILRRPWRAVWLGLEFAAKRYLAPTRIPGFFLRNPGRRYGLSYHAEQSPRAESRITLSDKCDALYLPRVDIDLRFAREDAEALVRAHERLDRWLRDEGLGALEYRYPLAQRVDAVLALATHGTHQIGTARMAESAEEGCVDANLKVFGGDNLYICSSAAFPTSGQCNPTFTIVAMACRLAAHLAAEPS